MTQIRKLTKILTLSKNKIEVLKHRIQYNNIETEMK